MAYNTSYNLKWTAQNAAGFLENTQVADFIRSKQADSQSDYAYAIYPDGGKVDDYPWYDHDADMKVLSEQFPNLLFTLHGEGADSGDIWTKYYLGGKVHNVRAVITIPDFDPTQLQEIK